MESSKTTAVQPSARRELNPDEVEANAKLERRQLEMLMMHALKISGGDLSLLLSPAALGDYQEQFVTLDAAALRVHEKGYRSIKNPLESRHANSVVQLAMRTGVTKQGSVHELGSPVIVKEGCSLIERFVIVPIDTGSLPCSVLLVANPQVSLSGKLTEDRLNRLHYLATVIAKRRLHRDQRNSAVSPLHEMTGSELALKQLTMESRHAIVTVTIDGHIESLNPAAAKLFSCKPRQAVGEDFSRYLSPKYFMPTLQRLSQSNLADNKSEKLRLNHRSVTVLDESGDVKSVATSAFYSVVKNQVSVTFVFSHPSVIRRSLLGQTSIANLVDTGTIGVVELDVNWHCENSNAAWSQLCGLGADASKGLGWTQAIYEEDLMDAWVSVGEMDDRTEPYTAVWRIKHFDGSMRWVAIHASSVVNELSHTTGFLFVCQDVSQAYRSQERIKQASIRDTLTGMLNRTEFLGQLQLRLNRRYQRSNVSLLMVQVDGLGEVNDALGQGVGDEALRQVTKQLQTNLGATVLCGRMSGSQFAFALTNSSNTNAVADLIGRTLKCSGKKFDVYGHTVLLNISVGFAAADTRTDSCDKLLKQAQMALKQTRKVPLPRRIRPAAKACDRDFSKTEYLTPVEPQPDDFSIACLLRNSSKQEQSSQSNFELSLIRKLCKQDDLLELS